MPRLHRPKSSNSDLTSACSTAGSPFGPLRGAAADQQSVAA